MVFAALQSLFRSRAPSKIALPDDDDVEIVPCNGIDVQLKNVVFTYGLLLDVRLDCDRLKASLFEVVEGKFRKAGSRLVFRNSTYEFHIPRSFSQATPPVAFTIDNYDEPYATPTRPQIPKTPAGFATPFVEPLPAFERYLRSEVCPDSLDAFLVPNTPAVHVHITTFDDLTFIGVTSTHMMFDATGVKTLLDAWTRRLNGASIEDIPGMEWDSMPLEAFPHVPAAGRRGWYDLPFFGKLRFICGVMWRKFRDPEDMSRLVCFPKSFLLELKEHVTEELEKRNSGQWAGSSDVLLAWWYKTVYAHRKDNAPISIHVPFDLRRIFSTSYLSTPYLHNAVMTLPIPPLPARAFATQSLADLAWHFRSAILSYTADTAGIEADVSFRLANPTKVLFPCQAHGEFVLLTNWRAAKFGELDFSGAVGAGARARVVFVAGYPKYSRGVPMRGAGIIMHEDEDAVWMIHIGSGGEWKRLRAAGTSRSGILRFVD
ncbi:hypothetical protein C8R46DRAFT_1206872 [Mycena filopes]|nr:hypothetical protein C8R46DRAFT_1206872 [Mycena filopes]